MVASIALTPDGRWDLELADLAPVVREAGFTSLGIGARGADATARAVYDTAGLDCHEVMALVVTDDAEATSSWAARLAEAAAAMRAPWVNTVFRAPMSTETARLIARCAATFADAGSAMAVEFSPLGSVPTITAGLEVVDIAGSGAGLMIDTWHFTFGDSTWEDLEGVPVERIAYVQFSDGLDPESEDLMAETMDRRVLPGDGIFSLDRFATTLLERGFEGVVSVEVLNRELRRLPVSAFVARAYDATLAYWR